MRLCEASQELRFGIYWGMRVPVIMVIRLHSNVCIADKLFEVTWLYDLISIGLGSTGIGSEASTRNWTAWIGHTSTGMIPRNVCVPVLAAGTIECVAQFILTGISQDAITLAWHSTG
jgi:hypothetical protein